MSIEQTSKPWANMSKPFNFVAHLLYTGPEKKFIKNCWKNEWFVFCDVFSKPPRKACYKSKIAWFTLITCLSRRFRKNITKDKLLIFSTILNEIFLGRPVYKRCTTKLDGLLMFAHGLLVCSIDIPWFTISCKKVTEFSLVIFKVFTPEIRGLS